jgi:mono/diheme cytochrome c family protein
MGSEIQKTVADDESELMPESLKSGGNEGRRKISVKKAISIVMVFVVGVLFGWLSLNQGQARDEPTVQVQGKKAKLEGFDGQIGVNAERMMAEGKQTFRFDTFGDEAFWGGQLRLHEAIAQTSPRAALGLGLKVDVEALPKSLVKDLEKGRVNLDDPAVTRALLKLNAVVGVTGFFQGDTLTSIGIQCALCHSTVDNSLAAGIGNRLDGWAARDLNVGEIVASAPDLSPFATLLGVSQDTVRQVLRSWGPGKFDAELILDGKAFRPDGKSAATLLPPAFGLAGVNLHTWTGWGSVTHWNAFVSNLEMHGKGTFYDPRLNDATKFPISAANGFGNVRNTPDLITAKLAALHFYQLAIPAPTPPSGSFNVEAAARGQAIFAGKAQCATCHVPPLFTEPGWNMHTAAEIGIDDFQAKRSPDEHYRTAPLKGLWTHQKGGFYHDGRFATLRDVVEHYNGVKGLALTEQEKTDLVQYLLSL